MQRLSAIHCKVIVASRLNLRGSFTCMGWSMRSARRLPASHAASDDPSSTIRSARCSMLAGCFTPCMFASQAPSEGSFYCLMLSISRLLRKGVVTRAPQHMPTRRHPLRETEFRPQRRVQTEFGHEVLVHATLIRPRGGLHPVKPALEFFRREPV